MTTKKPTKKLTTASRRPAKASAREKASINELRLIERNSAQLSVMDKRLASIEKKLGQVVSAVEDRLHKLDTNVDARADADTQRTTSRRDADTVHDASYAAADAKHASRAPNEHALDCDRAAQCSCGASSNSATLESVK
jgi:vacuolar-type H+-ATPase subunit E/Vma4